MNGDSCEGPGRHSRGVWQTAPGARHDGYLRGAVGLRRGGGAGTVSVEALEGSGVTMATRGYFRHGHHVKVSRLPEILRRVAGAPEGEALQPLEVAARDFLAELLADLGPDVSAARRALAETAAVTWLLLTSLDAYCVALAVRNGLVNKRSRVPFGVLDARHRTCSALVEQLRALGLDKVRVVKAVGLDTYLVGKRHRGRARGPGSAPLDRSSASSSRPKRDDGGRFRRVSPVAPEAESLELEHAEDGRVGAPVRAQARSGHEMSPRTAQDMAPAEIEPPGQANGPATDAGEAVAPAHGDLEHVAEPEHVEAVEPSGELERGDTAGARSSSSTSSAPASTPSSPTSSTTSSAPSSAEPTP